MRFTWFLTQTQTPVNDAHGILPLDSIHTVHHVTMISIHAVCHVTTLTWCSEPQQYRSVSRYHTQCASRYYTHVMFWAAAVSKCVGSKPLSVRLLLSSKEFFLVCVEEEPFIPGALAWFSVFPVELAPHPMVPRLLLVCMHVCMYVCVCVSCVLEYVFMYVCR